MIVIDLIAAMALISMMDMLRGGLAPYATWPREHPTRKILGEAGKWGMGICIALILGLPWPAVLLSAVLFRLSTNLGYGRPMGLYFGHLTAATANDEFCERLREFVGQSEATIIRTPLVSLAVCGALWGLPALVLAWFDVRALAVLVAWTVAMPAGAAIAKHLGPVKGSVWQNDVDSWATAGWWQVFRGFVAGAILALA